MISHLTKDSILHFGKEYRGCKLKNVPASYLLWIYENCLLPVQLKSYIEQNKVYLQAERKKMNKILYR